MKPYPKYMDSGVEWIGEVPEGWEVKKLKYSDKVIMGQSPSSDDYNDLNVGFPFLQGNADFTSLYPNPRIWCETAKKYAEKNDVLLSVRAPIGAVNIADQKYGIGRGLCAIRSIQSLPVLLFYFALSLNSELKRIGTGSTYTAISVVDVENIFIPNISSTEQKSIAAYLDHKTAQIDDLISKKQKLIELLKEERSAIINQAVTKGLNPDAPMKDSGVEWLGEIPEHWEVIRMRYVFNLLSGNGFPDHYQGKTEGDYPFYKVSDINLNGINVSFANNYVTRANVVENGWTIIPEKSILLAKIGEALKKNHRKINVSECLIDNNMLALVKRNNYYNTNYLYYLMLLIDMVWFINPGAIPSINLNKLRNIFVGIPEKSEQAAIAVYLDRKTTEIDQTISKIEKQIGLLKEFRTALISKVVTGKIDVRDGGSNG